MSRPDAWERWFAANEVAADDVHGMLFDQFALIAQAAASGLGAALLPLFPIERELAAGELVVAHDARVMSAETYYFVQPSDQGSYPALDRFRDWLVAEAAATRIE